MPIDTSIYANLLRPPESVADYTAKTQGIQQNALALANARIANQNAMRDQQESNDYREAAKGFGADPTANYTSLLQRGLPTQAAAYQKSALDGLKTQSDIHLNTSKSGEQDALAQMHKLDTSIKNHDFAVQKLSAITDPSQVPQWIHDSIQAGAFTPEQGMQGYMRFQQALQQPGGFDAWKQTALQGGQSATETLKQQQAALIAANANAVSLTNNAATNKTHLQAAGIAASTSRANNAANIAKDYNVAGLNPDGTPGQSNASIVDAIGKYQVAPPNGMALRNPRMQQILADVTAKYPEFDATTYGARQVAAKSFSTGKDGQAVQAANTGLNHLETVDQMAMALKNGDYPMFNKIANAYAQQTGQPAPTNMKSAVMMVAPEIVKAVVGAGGGVEDRAKAASVLDPNASPQQILGATGVIKDLLGGRLTETARTYQRTTGRNDFADTFLSPAAQKVLAARMGTAGTAHPPEIDDLLKKYGGK